MAGIVLITFTARNEAIFCEHQNLGYLNNTQVRSRYFFFPDQQVARSGEVQVHHLSTKVAHSSHALLNNGVTINPHNQDNNVETQCVASYFEGS